MKIWSDDDVYAIYLARLDKPQMTREDFMTMLERIERPEMMQSPCGCVLRCDCWAHTAVRAATPTPPPNTTPKSEAQE